jgi:DNA-binding transcriptional LysR family regulator
MPQNRPSGPRYYQSSYALTLQGFYHVAKLHSFTRAAEALGIDESTISLRVAALERDMNVKLFERRGRRGVLLTEEGRYLLDIAGPIVTGLEGIKEKFDDYLHKEVSGRVVIACNGIVSKIFLPLIIQTCHRDYPNIVIDAVRKSTAEIPESLERNEVNFAFATIMHVPETISYIEYARSELCIITQCEHPLQTLSSVTLEDIVEFPFILANESVFEVVRQTASLNGLEVQVTQRVATLDAVMRCVELGFGIAVIPLILTRDRSFSTDLSVIRAAHVFGSRSYGILYSRSQGLSRAAKAVIKVIWNCRLLFGREFL